jgi:hypothetical protein
MRTSCEIRTPNLVPNCFSQCKLHPEMRTPFARPKGVLISQVSHYRETFHKKPTGDYINHLTKLNAAVFSR